MYHVRGHMDKLLCSDQLPVEERVNCHADKLASEALVNGVANQRFISSNLPFKSTKLLVNGRVVTGSSKQAITQSWGEKVAQTLFHRRNMVRMADFNMVYWEGMDKGHEFVLRDVLHLGNKTGLTLQRDKLSTSPDGPHKDG